MNANSEIVAGQKGETLKIGASGVAALSLLAANASMLFLYFALDLTLFQLVVIYWLEALWVGVFSGLKLLTASLFGDPYENRFVDVSAGASFLLSLFAIAKSAGLFLFMMIMTGVALVAAHQELTGTDGTEWVTAQGMLLLKCSLIFAAGHGLSFIVNFVFRGEFRRARFITLIWLPFKRAIALFVTIVAALTAIQTWPGVLSSTGFAAILIAIKLAWDAFLHWRERAAFSAVEVRPGS